MSYLTDPDRYKNRDNMRDPIELTVKFRRDRELNMDAARIRVGDTSHPTDLRSHKQVEADVLAQATALTHTQRRITNRDIRPTTRPAGYFDQFATKEVEPLVRQLPSGMSKARQDMIKAQSNKWRNDDA